MSLEDVITSCLQTIPGLDNHLKGACRLDDKTIGVKTQRAADWLNHRIDKVNKVLEKNGHGPVTFVVYQAEPKPDEIEPDRVEAYQAYIQSRKPKKTTKKTTSKQKRKKTMSNQKRYPYHTTIWHSRIEKEIFHDNLDHLANSGYFDFDGSWAGKAQSRTIDALINIGFETVFAKLKEEGDGESAERLKVLARQKAIQKKIDQIEEKKRINEILEQVYQSEHLEGLIEFCQEIDIDHEPFLAEYAMLLDHDQSKRIRKWLFSLLSDGDKHHASKEIRPLMIEEGIIDDSEEDWQLVKVVASQEKFTKAAGYGYWGWARAMINKNKEIRK